MEIAGLDNSNAAAPPRKTAWWKTAVHAAILFVTLAAIGRHLWAAAEELSRNPIDFDPGWLALAVPAYALCLSILGTPWCLTLRVFHGPVSWAASLRAYLISHAAKYVPGKAMVVVVRIGLMAPRGVRPMVSVVSSFYDLLCELTAGAIVALLCLTVLPIPPAFARLLAERQWVIWLAAAMAAGFVVLALPAVFAVPAKAIVAPFRKRGEPPLPRIPLRTTLLAVAAAGVAWWCIGLSFFAAVQSVSGGMLEPSGLSMTTAAVALSIVLGVLSMIPGQLAIREWLLIEALAPVVQSDAVAVGASLLFRLVTLAVEFSLAGALYLAGGRR